MNAAVLLPQVDDASEEAIGGSEVLTAQPFPVAKSSACLIVRSSLYVLDDWPLSFRHTVL